MDSRFMVFVKKHSFWLFLILTILISWGPWILAGNRMLVYGPTIAGLIVIVISRGKEGLQDITKQLVQIKAHIKWWLIALFIPCAVAFIAIAINMLLGNELPRFEFFKGKWYFIILFFLMTFIGGPLAEEIGWRGYSVPYLQRKTTPLLTALIIGVVWGLWHIPEFFSQETLHYEIGAVYIPLFILAEIALSIVMTWLYNKTNSSLLIAGLLFHCSENFWSVVLTTNATMETLQAGQVAVNVQLWVLSIIVYILFAVGLVLSTKSKLGFQQTSMFKKDSNLV